MVCHGLPPRDLEEHLRRDRGIVHVICCDSYCMSFRPECRSMRHIFLPTVTTIWSLLPSTGTAADTGAGRLTDLHIEPIVIHFHLLTLRGRGFSPDTMNFEHLLYSACSSMSVSC